MSCPKLCTLFASTHTGLIVGYSASRKLSRFGTLVWHNRWNRSFITAKHSTTSQSTRTTQIRARNSSSSSTYLLYYAVAFSFYVYADSLVGKASSELRYFAAHRRNRNWWCATCESTMTCNDTGHSFTKQIYWYRYCIYIILFYNVKLCRKFSHAVLNAFALLARCIERSGVLWCLRTLICTTTHNSLGQHESHCNVLIRFLIHAIGFVAVCAGGNYNASI